MEYHFLQHSRKFWDGGIISNTALRELLSQHTIFWKETLGLDSEKEKLTYITWKDWKESKPKIPKVQVCIVNLHPSKEAGLHVPLLYDYDMTKDRENYTVLPKIKAGIISLGRM